ncbi:MAG TPA: 30S ribosomal protein S1, partial [Paludibacteraceae bacterium]|nr:30S ribosomal protein S1 [Paludibacteraceae bacterium]
MEELNKNMATPVADFDWDAYAKGDMMTGEEKAALAAKYDQTLNQVKDKEVVTGTIISMNKREVVVNIG